MQLHTITPLILTYNEENNIGRTLDRLRWAARIVVVDSYSTDATLDIVARYPQAMVIQRHFDSFASQCNVGLEYATTEWVLSLDADYVCPHEFIAEIASLPENNDVAGYSVPFRYCIFGRPLRGTLYPDRTVLYRRAKARYIQDGHGHRVTVSGSQRKLTTPIYHDDRKPLDVWIVAQRKYAKDEANKLLDGKPHDLGMADRIRLTKVIAPLVVPLYALFVQRGILDGQAGIYYAFQRACAEILLSLELIAADLRPDNP